MRLWEWGSHGVINALIRRETRELICWLLCEDIARRQPCTSQEENSHQNPAMLHPDLGLHPPELWEINFVYGILLWQPKRANTPINFPDRVSLLLTVFTWTSICVEIIPWSGLEVTSWTWEQIWLYRFGSLSLYLKNGLGLSLTLSAQAQSQPSPAAGPTLLSCPEVKGQMISHVTGAVEGKMKHKEQGMERWMLNLNLP